MNKKYLRLQSAFKNDEFVESADRYTTPKVLKIVMPQIRYEAVNNHKIQYMKVKEILSIINQLSQWYKIRNNKI